jgi:hypothetical protein
MLRDKKSVFVRCAASTEDVAAGSQIHKFLKKMIQVYKMSGNDSVGFFINDCNSI